MECAVIGAGVVGLACARALALAGREVVILEAERAFGTATSARNSEVIHAGLHYPQGSRKARLCARGKELLYDYCARRGVPHRRCEKLVVACSPDERPRLEELYRAARSNGVGDVRLLSAGEARALEPEIACEAALLSPSTGIVDSHALMLALLRDAEEAGAMLAVESRVMSGRVRSDGVELFVATGGTRFEVAAEPPSARGTAGASSAPRSADADTTLRAAIVVNCAGLDACRLAASFEGLDPRHVPAPFFAQGAYFTLAGRAPFSRLVYPVPAPTGHLGVHLTLDLAGQARFGPSFKWVDRVDYAVDPADARGFVEAVRRYWPGLPGGALSPGYAGVRPKISGPGEPAADFRIDGPEVHGIAGLVSLFGIESPGLTAALAIGEEVAARLKRPATT